MKKFLLLSASTLISFVSVAAGNVRETTRPTYLIPGAELKVARAKSIIAGANLVRPDIHRSHVRPVADTPQVKFVRTNGTALDVTPKNVITIDTALVVSYDYCYNDMWENRTEENKAKIEYDKYGRRTLLAQGNDTTRYTYTVDENTRWLSRITEHKDWEGWSPVSKEERTIENNRVKSMTLYKVTGYDYYTRDFCKERYYEFEYGHSEYSSVNGKNIKNAAITHEISFSENGDTIQEDKYTWASPVNRYIRTYSYSGGSKSDAQIYDDHIVTTYYERPYSYETETYTSDFIKTHESTEFFGKKTGRLDIYFNEDGSEGDTYGNIHEGWREANGDSVTIVYSYNSALGFSPAEKYVYSADFLKPADYSSDFFSSATYYKYLNGDWSEQSLYSLKHHILPNGLSEVTQTSYGQTYSSTVKMEKIIEDDYERWESYPAIINEDGSYTVVKSDNDDYIYAYYSAEGTLQKTIWQKEVRNPEGTTFFIQLPGETAWNPLVDYTNTISSGGMTMRTVYKTTADGKPLSVTEYTTHPSYNGGVEFKSLETLYSYKDNGDFTVETYETYTPTDLTKLAISEKSERLTLEDGTIQTTDLEYDDNGKGQIYSGNRSDFKDFVTRQYTYVRRSGTWENTNTYVDDEVYTTEDGTEVRIHRRLSDDNTYAINEHKYENLSTYDADGNQLYYMGAEYHWDTENNKWIGDYKSDTRYFRFIFDCKDYEYLFDPIAAYNDEYMVVTDEEPYNNPEFNDSKGWSYNWDSEKDAWVADKTETLDYKLEGNTLIKTETKHEENEWETKDESTITKKTTDSFNRISQIEKTEERTRVSHPDEETEHSIFRDVTSYAYNKTNGLLSEKKEARFDEDGKEIWSHVYRYTYSTFNIETSEITDIVKDDNSGIIIDGLNVSAAGEIISVFNIKGQLISRESEATTLPSVPGIYIIKAGNSTHKIAIR